MFIKKIDKHIRLSYKYLIIFHPNVEPLSCALIYFSGDQFLHLNLSI